MFYILSENAIIHSMQNYITRHNETLHALWMFEINGICSSAATADLQMTEIEKRHRNEVKRCLRI